MHQLGADQGCLMTDRQGQEYLYSVVIDINQTKHAQENCALAWNSIRLSWSRLTISFWGCGNRYGCLFLQLEIKVRI